MKETYEEFGIGTRMVNEVELPPRLKAALAMLKRIEAGEVTIIERGTDAANDVMDALEMVKRIKAGTSVEIRKVGGEWPTCIDTQCVEDDGKDVSFTEAAAAWNAKAARPDRLANEAALDADVHQATAGQACGERDAAGRYREDLKP